MSKCPSCPVQGTINGKTMKQWLNEVDAIINGQIGMSVHDLADFPIYDYWSDGVPPSEGAYLALENDDIGKAFLDMGLFIE